MILNGNLSQAILMLAVPSKPECVRKIIHRLDKTIDHDRNGEHKDCLGQVSI